MKANATILDKRLGILFQRQFQQSIRIFSMLCFLFFMNSSYATIYHVSKTGDDSNNGLAWGTSFLTLQKALTLSALTAGDEIWVAKGTYYPDEGPGYINNNPSQSFIMIEGVGIYGGFSGNEINRADRDWVNNETILSGDIDYDTDPLVITGSGSTLSIIGNTYNTFHIIRNVNNTLSISSILDGFSITGGSTNPDFDSLLPNGGGIENINSSPSLFNLKIEGNSGAVGGAIYLGISNSILNNITISRNNAIFNGGGIGIAGGSPSINNCYFEGNFVTILGGAIYQDINSSLNLIDCSFTDNSAGEEGVTNGQGGAIHNLGSITATGCTFANNEALGNDSQGGAIYNHGATLLYLSDCSFTGNSATVGSGGGIYNLNSDAVLNACTFTSNSAIKGGGMYNEASHPILNACIFSDNTSGSGGGMYNFNSSPVLTDCEFVTNIAQAQGGGMYNTDASIVEITNCQFNGNNAASSTGGAINNYSSTINISQSEFTNNLAGDDGGAISNEGTLYVSNSQFESNKSLGRGGALYCNSEEYITNCTFKGNESQLAGGGVASLNTEPLFTNCIFSGNYSHTSGGGYARLGKSGGQFINCTFTGNSAANSGGGIFAKAGAQTHLSIKNCILWGNSSEAITSTGSFTINHSTVPTSLLGLGTGNSDKDPLFADQPDYINAPSLEGDLHLTECSPAIDAGLDSYNTSTEDLDGNDRHYEAIAGGEQIDMGAYEYQSPVVPIAICVESYTASLDGSGSVSIPLSEIENGSTGCGPLSFSSNLGNGNLVFGCGDVGDPFSVILIVTDINGTSATCSAAINVIDEINPIVFCPANISVNNEPGLCTYVVTDYPISTSFDNCGSATITHSIPSGSSFPVGTSTVIVTATDGSGNSSSCSFSIIVSDEESPVIECSDITVYTTTESCAQVVTYAATATDNCPGLNVEYSIESGSIFELGETGVVVTATDAYGNVSSCSFTVTVIDNTPPTAVCQDLTINMTGNSSTITADDINDGSYDNCSEVIIAISKSTFTCNEGGEHTVTLTVTDVAGNSSTCLATVTVGPDADCDGVSNSCDVCPGGDDSIDNNNDNLPDCKYPPTFNNIIAAWKCGNNNNKVSVCHKGNNTLCVSYSAIAAHIGHGDYIGPCGNANCNNNSLKKQDQEMESISHVEENEHHEVVINITPNPNHGMFTLSIDGIEGLKSQISILDPVGKEIFTQTVHTSDHAVDLPINLEAISAGQYVIKFSNERECVSKKMILIR